MFWVILIAVTGVITLVILGAFGWRVYVAVRVLLREIGTATKVLGQATEVLNGLNDMDGVKAMRARTQHD
jgi:hypothetical protein